MPPVSPCSAVTTVADPSGPCGGSIEKRSSWRSVVNVEGVTIYPRGSFVRSNSTILNLKVGQMLLVKYVQDRLVERIAWTQIR